VYGALSEEEALYDFDSGFEAGLGVILGGLQAANGAPEGDDAHRP
jgi:hypothetical protein